MTDAVLALLGEVLAEVRALRAERAVGQGDEAITIDEACRRLGCGRSRLFELLAAGVVQRAQRIGKRQMVLASSVRAAVVAPSVYVPATPKPRGRHRSKRIDATNWGDAIRRLPLPAKR